MNLNIIQNTHFTIRRFKNGVQLTDNPAIKIFKDSTTIEQIFDSPFSVYFLNPDGDIQGINPSGAVLNRFDCANDALGCNVKKIMHKNSYLQFRIHDESVMHTGQYKSEEHWTIWKDGNLCNFFDYKFPWYNQQNKIIGIFGMAFDLSDNKMTDPLKKSLDYFVKNLLGFKNFDDNIIEACVKDITLTKRETDCAKLIMQGLSAKMIGLALNISHRTVEHYIENLKTKLNVSTKFQLIEILHSYFY